MRKIEIVDDFRLSFAGQPPAFDTGLEVGAISALMAHGVPFISRQISSETMRLLRPVADHCRYELHSSPLPGDLVDVVLKVRTGKPNLRVV